MNSRLTILFLIGISLLSCTVMNYDVTSSPEGSELSFEFDFSGVVNRPDSIPGNATVLMSELVRDTRYCFNTESGFSITGENAFPVNNGDYCILSVSGIENRFFIRGFESFYEGRKPTSLSTLELELEALSDEQVAELYCPGLVGIAGSYATLPPIEPIYLSIDAEVPIFFREPGEKITLALKPVEISVRLDFSVELNLEEGVVVDSVFAAISGVPFKLMLRDGSAVKDTLGKSFFRMMPESGNYTSGIYSGSVNTMGLFSANFGDYITGPGIFWVVVIASCEGRSRVISAGLNIKEMIDAANVMESSDDGQTWVLATDKASFPIQEKMKIDRDMVLCGGEDGVKGWITISDENNPIVVEM